MARCFPVSLEISGRGCPRILSRHHFFSGVANLDAFEESACKSGEALSPFAGTNYLSRTCRINGTQVEVVFDQLLQSHPRKNNTGTSFLNYFVPLSCRQKSF